MTAFPVIFLGACLKPCVMVVSNLIPASEQTLETLTAAHCHITFAVF